MRQLFILIAVIGLVSACKKQTLDTLAFPGQTLDSYSYENYEDPEIDIPDSMLQNVERSLVTLTSIDAETGEEFKIYGLYFGDTNTIDQDTVIYYCHGQARHMDFYYTRATLLSHLVGQHHYGVFMIDYRGYGLSEGKSTETGLIEDVDAGIEWLRDHGLSQDRCMYYGFSLGAIPIIERAGNKTNFKPSKVICESPLASVQYLTQSSTVINSDASFITELQFNNAENIKKVDAPFMWLHGVDDDYVSIDNGEIIYGNYQGPYKEAIRVENANHSDIPVIMGLENYLNAVELFIQQ